MLEERVLVGTGISSRELLRPLGYSVVADLIHHVRNELPLAQLARVVYVFSLNLNDPSFTSSIQTMCAKLLNTIIESIYSKGDQAETARIMKSMFFTSLEKLVAMTDAFDRLKALSARDKGKGKAKEVDPSNPDEAAEDVEMEEPFDERLDKYTHGWREIEQAMPVHFVAYANESLELFCRGESISHDLLPLPCTWNHQLITASQRPNSSSRPCSIHSARSSPLLVKATIRLLRLKVINWANSSSTP